jgi:hypothetical protein
VSIDARRAARKVIEACRRGDAELIRTPPVRLAVLLNAACPGTVARAMEIANWLLPAPADGGGWDTYSGWQSVSRVAPSAVTRLSDRATLENNETPAGAPA